MMAVLMMIKTYSQMLERKTFEDRFDFLKTTAMVGDMTFGGHRWLNQDFYKSKAWRKVRRDVIIRDNGCDLAIEDRPISKEEGLIVHHINPITEKDIYEMTPLAFDPEYLVCVSTTTHNAIHYGDSNLLMPSTFIERTPFDTSPWRKGGFDE